MGVDTAVPSASKGYSVEEVSPLGAPEDYFYRLALDTLQVSVKGDWLNEKGAVLLMEKRRSAEEIKDLGFGQISVQAPGGVKLVVFPHGGRPSYHVLMRDGDGLEVRALPSANMPTFIFRFGARWCVENPISYLGEWTTEFVRSVGFQPKKIQLSEAHVRCDAPVPFTASDLKKMRGLTTRNGAFDFHMSGGKLSGIDNLGGKKRLKFCIYDKRLEQKQKEGVLWPALWKSYGIEPDVPIWRVEARWDREGLNAVGLNDLADLHEGTIAGIWHLFTTKYLLFVSDPSKRTSRSPISRKWARIQSCGKFMDRQPISAKVGVTYTQLFKQATGCIASAMAKAGMGYAKDKIDEVVYDAIRMGDERFRKGKIEHIQKLLTQALDQYPDEVFASANTSRGEIKALIDRAVSRKLPARSFGAKARTDGGAQ